MPPTRDIAVYSPNAPIVGQQRIFWMERSSSWDSAIYRAPTSGGASLNEIASYSAARARFVAGSDDTLVWYVEQKNGSSPHPLRRWRRSTKTVSKVGEVGHVVAAVRSGSSVYLSTHGSKNLVWYRLEMPGGSLQRFDRGAMSARLVGVDSDYLYYRVNGFNFQGPSEIRRVQKGTNNSSRVHPRGTPHGQLLTAAVHSGHLYWSVRSGPNSGDAIRTKPLP